MGSNEPIRDVEVSQEGKEQQQEGFGVQLYAVAFCAFLCFFGQIFIWIKETAIVPTLSVAGFNLPMTLGTYAFMMFLSAVINVLSLYKGQPWLYWATVAVGLSIVLDVNICVNDWLVDYGAEIKDTNKAWNWELRVGYICSLVGYVGSFIALPVKTEKLNFRETTSIAGIVIGVWLIAANAAVWANEGGVKNGSHICPIGYKVANGTVKPTGLPVHLSRAFMTGVLHILVSVFQWEGGQWLTFLIAAVSVSDYMPAGAGPGRCAMGTSTTDTDVNKACEVGVWMSFFGMWFVVLAHIFLKKGNKTPDFSKLNPMNGLRPTFGLFGFLMCFTGMIMVAAKNHKKNDENKAIFGEDVGKYKDLGAQEVYDVFHTWVGSALVLWAFAAGNNRIGVAGLSFYFSVYNRLLGTAKADGKVAFIGACPWKYSSLASFGIHNNTDATVRAGFILLFAGSLLTVAALLNLAAPKIDASRQQICGIFVLTCVAWMWSASKWYGQMGFTALLGATFHTFEYKHGLDAVFFWACLQLASQTPFTTCEGLGDFKAFIVTIATFGLFGLCYFHMDARGDAKGEPCLDEGEEEAIEELAIEDEEKKVEEAVVEEVKEAEEAVAEEVKEAVQAVVEEVKEAERDMQQ